MRLPFDAAELLRRFDALDRALVARGWPACSPWWRAELERFAAAEGRRWVVRAGRRAGKSTMIARLGALWALLPHKVPSGDVGTVVVVAQSRDEAAARLASIAGVLEALAVPHRRSVERIDLEGRPISVRTFAATSASVRGPTAVAILCDELAFWRDHETGANPARHVLAALRPAAATMPYAIEILSSSPFGFDDAHARAFDEGDTSAQVVSQCATWVGNPSITEAATHEIEPDERVWSREFAAVPSENTSAAFSMDLIDRAMRPTPPIATWGEPILSVDLSSGRFDSAAWAPFMYGEPSRGAPHLFRNPSTGELSATDDAAHFVVARDERGELISNPAYFAHREPLFVMRSIDAVDGAFAGRTSAEDLVAAMAKTAKEAGAWRVVGDQHSALFAESAFRRHGLRYVSIPWSNQSKIDAVSLLRRHLRDGTIILPRDEALKLELLRFQEKILPSGAITYAGRGRSHDDRVATIITALTAELSAERIWSEHRRSPLTGSSLT